MQVTRQKVTRSPVVRMHSKACAGRAETCSAGGGGGGWHGRAQEVGGGVGKLGFRAGTLCYVVLALLVQILPATKIFTAVNFDPIVVQSLMDLPLTCRLIGVCISDVS